MNRVRDAFDAAQDYDSHARVQAMVARRLADAIADLPLPRAPRVLEIGCGTGLLTRALADRGLGGEWLVTDVASGMVERCRAALGKRSGTRFAVLDGEEDQPGFAGRFDLVCSSLALQWFADPAAALARMHDWLAPGGHLAVTTLADGTFAEWRAAHARAGAEAATPVYPDGSALRAMLPGSGTMRINRFVDAHGDAGSFLRGLRAIGAHRPREDRRPIGPAAMRRVFREFVDAGASVTYEVATLICGKAP